MGFRNGKKRVAHLADLLEIVQLKGSWVVREARSGKILHLKFLFVDINAVGINRLMRFVKTKGVFSRERWGEMLVEDLRGVVEKFSLAGVQVVFVRDNPDKLRCFFISFPARATTLIRSHSVESAKLFSALKRVHRAEEDVLLLHDLRESLEKLGVDRRRNAAVR